MVNIAMPRPLKSPRISITILEKANRIVTSWFVLVQPVAEHFDEFFQCLFSVCTNIAAEELCQKYFDDGLCSNPSMRRMCQAKCGLCPGLSQWPSMVMLRNVTEKVLSSSTILTATYSSIQHQKRAIPLFLWAVFEEFPKESVAVVTTTYGKK